MTIPKSAGVDQPSICLGVFIELHARQLAIRNVFSLKVCDSWRLAYGLAYFERYAIRKSRE